MRAFSLGIKQQVSGRKMADTYTVHKKEVLLVRNTSLQSTDIKYLMLLAV